MAKIQEDVATERIKLKVRAVGRFENGLVLESSGGAKYYWFTTKRTSQLFYADETRWFMVSGTLDKSEGLYQNRKLTGVRVLKETRFI